MHNVNEYDEYQIDQDGGAARFDEAPEYVAKDDFEELDTEVRKILLVIKEKGLGLSPEDLPKGASMSLLGFATFEDEDFSETPDEILISAPARLVKLATGGLSHADLFHPWLIHWSPAEGKIHVHYHHHSFDGNHSPLHVLEYSERAFAFTTEPWNFKGKETLHGAVFIDTIPMLHEVPRSELAKVAFSLAIQNTLAIASGLR